MYMYYPRFHYSKISMEETMNNTKYNDYTRYVCVMYNDCETLLSTRAGDTEYFRVGVGLHKGFALSPLPLY